MAISRYKNLHIIGNSDADYRKKFSTRYDERNSLQHYETQVLEYPTFDDIRQMETANHMWSLGDRYYKLANAHYGSPKYWWVIAWFNKKPTEQHVNLGDVIKIPLPLRDALEVFGL
jgi:hypothetical protein